MRSTPTFIRLHEVPIIPAVNPNAVSIGATAKHDGSFRTPESVGSVTDIGARLQEVCTALVQLPACVGRLSLTQTVIGDAMVRADCVAPTMLIVGEAVTNAAKYAHPTGVPGKIHVDCRRGKDGALQIEVADDGVGLPEGFDPAVDGTFGFQLMRGLSEKLGATLLFKSEGLGLRMALRVPAEVCAADAPEIAEAAPPEAESTEAVPERKQAHERQELILAEMKHRIRNTLATVQAIAMETWRSASEEERSAFNARLRALADSHDLLTMDNWDRASLRDIVARALHPFTEKHSDRLQIDGVDLRLSGSKSLLLTMALHELATNAAKYGALSNGQGRVEVTWGVPQGDAAGLRLTWRETGGPPVVPPRRKGFGSFLVERAFNSDQERAYIEFDPKGVVCTLEMDL